DNVNTMLDPSLPLTIGEYEEWGNPEEAEAFEWLMQYSPYENVEAVDYPPIYATAGLNDPRVSYWEPAKWIAKLRDTAVGRRRFLLKTEMGAGHGGPSGRYDAWRDEARIQAFILEVFDLADGSSEPSRVDREGSPTERPR
ncbi:MAG: prolyl oligopeptidase family serine peptidase, partial [Actinomycetia bacterium]|nr:prolyl oligopeptidase family serine peptidase [Actinomycetes bacterium]